VGGSDFLFVRPSFLNGMARVVDVFAELDDYNVSETPEEADARAIRSDWQALSKDIEAAMKKINLAALAK
jgi:hypothetical protein